MRESDASRQVSLLRPELLSTRAAPRPPRCSELLLATVSGAMNGASSQESRHRDSMSLEGKLRSRTMRRRTLGATQSGGGWEGEGPSRAGEG